jgi:hypothetical protein
MTYVLLFRIERRSAWGLGQFFSCVSLSRSKCLNVRMCFVPAGASYLGCYVLRLLQPGRILKCYLTLLYAKRILLKVRWFQYSLSNHTGHMSDQMTCACT